ncbi:hypothetical protein BDD43_0501 [Mucilaginibacter gracilis]|uniref:Uncharacterized protein n=1 Tax=Mucilaginibacter gracilis TaxID=423350 RepID=A0A495IUH0_9SPHI|nr:hypothetical protein [Mucilaginibacter gracilis]RKR80396.1 hypothetical protein BDD43_0501 [Mucilaginibacter gracilis]
MIDTTSPWVYVPLILIGAVLLIYIIGNFVTGGAIFKSDLLAENSVCPADLVYYLPAASLQLTVTASVVGTLGAEQTVESAELLGLDFVNTVSIVPDTDYGLALQYQASAFAADEMKCVVDTNGLLSSIQTTTDDRIAGILNEIANAPLKLLEGKGLASTPRASLTEKKGTTNLTFEKTFNLPLTGIPKRLYPMPWKINIPGGTAEPVDASFSILFDEVIEKTIDKSKMKAVSGILTRPMRTINMQILAAFEGKDTKTAPNEVSEILPKAEEAKKDDAENDEPSKKEKMLQQEDDAVKKNTKTQEPAEKIAKPDTLAYEEANARLEYHFLITIPDTSRLIKVEVKRSSFVKRANAPKFVSGLLTENSITKPSEIEGFAAIPVGIGKALISIPARLLTFTVQNKKTELELQKQLLALQQEAAKKDGLVGR